MSVETLLRVYGHHHPDHSADVHDGLRRQRLVNEIRERKETVLATRERKNAVKSISD
jgi:hypothetical protein